MKILGFDITRGKKTPPPKQRRKEKPIKKKTDTAIPPGRVSQPGQVYDDKLLGNIKKNLNIVKPDFLFESIPLIRKLYKVNEDLGLALFDSIQLTNTGHEIKFNQSVKPELADEMRAHLKEVSKRWHTGSAGIDGLVNKWIAQIYVGGALSIEWVPDQRLTGIESNILINPETIRYGRDRKGKYKPYQKIYNVIGYQKQYIPLNENTFQYFALLADEDTPYGVPPFLSALQSISTQKAMKDNIHHIMNQMGLLGYLETTVTKPDQNAGESDPAYMARITNLLTQTKQNVINGFKEGVVVGFTEDHQFEFHSTTKNLGGVSDIFNMNENQLANGLKTSPSFLGVSGGSSESFLSIVFTKTLSQLKNVQQILSSALQRGYELELQLAGYDYKSLSVEFRASTITDDMKIQQGKEIKQRVLRNLWIDRIISPETYAEEMGYTKPHQKIDPPMPGVTEGGDQKKKEDREADKNKSDRKGRDKKKDQPKRKDKSTKPV